MKSRIVRANATHKLERSEEHEERGRQNVGEREGATVREVRVQGGGRIIRRGWRAWIEQYNRAPHGHGEANESQENYRDPQESYESRIRMHRPIPRLL